MEPPLVLDPSGQHLHAEAAELRKQGPIARVTLPGDVVAWSVTRSDVLRRLLNDRRVSRDGWQHWPAIHDIPQDWPLYLWVATRSMFTSYGADHKRLRSLVTQAFTARRIATLRPRVEAIVAELLDTIAAEPAGQVVDLKAAFAHPLPIAVICHLFDVPVEVRPALQRAYEVLWQPGASPAVSLAAHQELYAILDGLLTAKRATPGEDLTSALIAARAMDEGAKLSEAELIDTLLLFISAGHETTVSLLDQAITAMLTHPDQLTLVRSGEVSWADVIEETLRWEAPVAYVPLRYAVDDIDVDGVVIRKGEAILVNFAAASRDPAVHGDTADTFDVTRADKSHVSFGHGVHYCIGAPLARMEAMIALPALFERFPAMSFAVPPRQLTHLDTFISNGHRELPVLRAGR